MCANHSLGSIYKIKSAPSAKTMSTYLPAAQEQCVRIPYTEFYPKHVMWTVRMYIHLHTAVNCVSLHQFS